MSNHATQPGFLSSNPRQIISLFFFLFILSGFTALLYQVLWHRVLTIFSGADVYSASIIVAAFMLGLGLDSLTGGYFADRITIRQCIYLYAFCELGLALFAYGSVWIYYDFLTTYLSPRGQLVANFPHDQYVH